MNDILVTNPMQEYRTSLRRKQIHQGLVVGVKTHAPFGQNMECAIVELNNGLKGMIYEQQFDNHKYRSLVGFIDHKIDFMVLDVTKQGLDPKTVEVFNEEKGLVILSRIQALEELQEEFWENADVNHVITGVVSGFENERLYMKIKGVDCVLPIQDYEYDWTPSARNLVPLGKELTVVIKRLDRVGKKVWVSRKELLEDPWLRIHDNFNAEDFARGVITSVVPDVGIFVKLAPGVESLAWFPDRLPNHGELIGKTVAVRIKSVKQAQKQIKSKIVNFPHELI